MDYLLLNKFEEGKISASELVRLNKNAIYKYIDDRMKKRSIAIEVKHEDLFNGYDRAFVMVLLTSYLKEEILEWDLDYILNCLDLLDDEPSEPVISEVLFSLSNPEINIPITKSNILKVLKFLDEGRGIEEVGFSKKFEIKSYRTILSP